MSGVRDRTRVRGMRGKLTAAREKEARKVTQEQPKVRRHAEEAKRTPIPPWQTVLVPQQKRLRHLVAEKDLDGPCSVRRRNEPSAGSETADCRHERDLVEVPPHLLVQPQRFALLLLDHDRRRTDGTTGRLSLRCRLRVNPLEETVGVGEEGARAGVNERPIRLLDRRRVADPARSFARHVDAHGPLRWSRRGEAIRTIPLLRLRLRPTSSSVRLCAARGRLSTVLLCVERVMRPVLLWN